MGNGAAVAKTKLQSEFACLIALFVYLPLAGWSVTWRRFETDVACAWCSGRVLAVLIIFLLCHCSEKVQSMLYVGWRAGKWSLFHC
jgi:hypothetical protein